MLALNTGIAEATHVRIETPHMRNLTYRAVIRYR